MKITLFIGGLTGGGAERVICNLANYFYSKNYDVEIITMSECSTSYNLDEHISVVSLIKDIERKSPFHNLFIRFKHLRNYMKTKDRDCYIVMLPVSIIMMLLCSKITDAPIIVSERADPRKYGILIISLLKFLSHRADGYVFQTNDVKLWYEKYLTKTKVKLIPNAINEEFVGNVYDGPRKNKIVSVGRINTQKNFPMLIKAFSKICDEFPDYKLQIYGDGPLLNHCKNLAKEFNISEKVEFPGFVKNVVDSIKDSSLFVLPSDYEGMPNALMEAMALGLPCISTDCPVGGPKFLINDGENGLLVPVGDADTLADAMRKILSDKDFADKLGENATKITQRLAPEKIYGEWEEFVNNVVLN